MRIKCLLIDDEPFAVNILADDLADFPAVEILATFNSPLEVAHFLQRQVVDLLFLDIQMPEMLGTQFLRALKNPPLVIFTTAFHHYAVEGFELNAVDYLLKPIRKERLAAALKKVENLLVLRQKWQDQDKAENLVINVEYQKVKLLVDEILYIEGLKDYVKIYLVNRVYPLLTRSNLRGMEAKLPPKYFVRIHNSYIINKQKVVAFTHDKVSLPGVELPVGRMYIDAIKSFQ